MPALRTRDAFSRSEYSLILLDAADSDQQPRMASSPPRRFLQTVLTSRPTIRPLKPTSVRSLPPRPRPLRPPSQPLADPHPQPRLASINVASRRAAAMSTAAPKRATRTTSSGQRTRSSSSAASAAKTASRRRTTPLWAPTVPPRSSDRRIFPRRSVSSGRVCRGRSANTGSN